MSEAESHPLVICENAKRKFGSLSAEAQAAGSRLHSGFRLELCDHLARDRAATPPGYLVRRVTQAMQVLVGRPNRNALSWNSRSNVMNGPPIAPAGVPK